MQPSSYCLSATTPLWGALRREGLLGFGVGWRASFISVANRTSGFFRTVTQRMGTRSNKAAKIKGVIRFHSALARRIHQRPQDLTSKGDKLFGWLRSLTRFEGTLFGDFQICVAGEYLGHCDNTVYNVSTPPRHIWIGAESNADAIQAMFDYTMSHYHVYVGPHALDFLRRLYGLGRRPVPVAEQRDLLAMFHAESYPVVMQSFGAIGWSVHDALLSP